MGYPIIRMQAIDLLHISATIRDYYIIQQMVLLHIGAIIRDYEMIRYPLIRLQEMVLLHFY